MSYFNYLVDQAYEEHFEKLKPIKKTVSKIEKLCKDHPDLLRITHRLEYGLQLYEKGLIKGRQEIQRKS